MPWKPRVWSEADLDKPGVVRVSGKMDTLPILSFSRPHGRALHTSWIAFFVCFFLWFSIPPLLETLAKPRCEAPDSELCLRCADQFKNLVRMAADQKCKLCAPRADGLDRGCGGLGLSQQQIIFSNVVSVAGTILIRLIIGSFADRFGVRMSFGGMLLLFSIPGFAAAAMDSYESFIVVRFLISFVGGSFVLTQMWTTIMFHDSVLGTANAVSAGLGNAGAGVALAVVAGCFKHLKDIGYTNDQAWRLSLVWPPALLVVLGVWILFCTDDCPFGPISEVRKRREEAELEPTTIRQSLWGAAANWRTWVLFNLYAWSFGILLVVSNNISLYFSRAFSMSQHDSAQLGSLMGILAVFGRPAGGYFSDLLQKGFGLRGRLWALFLCALGNGCLMLAFATITKDQGGKVLVVVCLGMWGLLLTMTTGAVYALVPFVEPDWIGGVTGIVSAGGNLGALVGNCVLVIGDRPGLMLLGYVAVMSALTVPLLWMEGYGSMFRGPTQLLRLQYKMSAEASWDLSGSEGDCSGACAVDKGEYASPWGSGLSMQRSKFLPTLTTHLESCENWSRRTSAESLASHNAPVALSSCARSSGAGIISPTTSCYASVV